MDDRALLVLGGEIGWRLMNCGAEIFRVEESVSRIFAAYGKRSPQVFAIPNCLTVSFLADDGEPLSQIRRVQTHGTDSDRLSQYNDLCRTICRETPDEEWIKARLAEVQARPGYSPPMLALAYMLCGGGFTVFFGGSLRDCLCGLICGFFIWLSLTFFGFLKTNPFFSSLVSAAFSAVIAMLLTYAGIGQNHDAIIIGAFMGLVPGVCITTAMRDVMAGEIVSGLSRLAEALLTATSIALGTGVAIAVVRLLTGVVL